MTDVREFDEPPPPAERLVWCEWLRRHGVDPSDVVIPGFIERRPDRYQLAYEACARNPDGSYFLSADRQTVRVVHVFQMEAPPLPFPLPQEVDGA